MLRCLREADVLARTRSTFETLMRYVLRVCDQPRLISVVLLVAAGFMKDTVFQSLWMREEVEAWFDFEGVVLDAVQEDPEVNDLYIDLEMCILKACVARQGV
jgi:hypothetical protein